VALLLRRQGIKRIRPLQGGLDGWREAGFPLQEVSLSDDKTMEALTQIVGSSATGNSEK
jgi:3-mercaptopyruvate sulfurtransferase SseA